MPGQVVHQRRTAVDEQPSGPSLSFASSSLKYGPLLEDAVRVTYSTAYSLPIPYCSSEFDRLGALCVERPRILGTRPSSRWLPCAHRRRAYADAMSQTPTSRLVSRPGRLALVISDLAELRGARSGVVELPHRMVWLPPEDRRFDLEDPYDLSRVYEIVLREAVQFDELRSWLDATTLMRLWPELFLPRGVRLAWEQRHPQLVSRQAAA